jgi:polyribonucleotide nucleotidyltransferase
MEITYKTQIGKETLSLMAGKVAKQASGSVMVQYGETIVLVTVVAAKEERADTDFLPLTVEYQEKIYAAGRIPGNYFRREIGRPSEKETLTARLTDRPLRPLFPKGYCNETQVIATVLSTDKVNEPDILALNGASAALTISDIPFDGPVASVRVGRVNGSLMINPTLEEQKLCDINVIVAGSRTGITMVEGGGNIVSEAEMLEAIFYGHEQLQPILDIQDKLKESIGKPKREFTPKKKDADLVAKIESATRAKISDAITTSGKDNRKDALSQVRAEFVESLGPEYEDRKKEISEIFHDIERQVTREIILNQTKRIDGRRFDEIRPIECEAAILPRVHGSGLFTRGETQVLAVMTLGSGPDEQRVETLSGDENVSFMLHYNFPPYSVGETKRLSGPSRRDVGHGALAKRAIEKVLPDKEKFDYTIRIVSEVLESNGSSSMGTVCAATLALMDGGVPIKAPVSGIAMGLVAEGDQVAVLSDILGDEDHSGDMDFKVAGTRDGVTALQMDIKIKSLSRSILEKALEQARAGRLHILDKIEQAINAPREELSPYAPHVYRININPERIGEIIGPGGKMIRSIQSETNTSIEIDDTGLVKIAAFSKEEGDKAAQIVKGIGMDPVVGEIYDGTVVKTTDFGAFVQIRPKTEGLVHISELAPFRVKRVKDIVKEGDIVKVKVIEVSKDGKIKLSRKALLAEENPSPTPDSQSQN